jgi:tetratricopeptide (TPR) repeat protein
MVPHPSCDTCNPPKAIRGSVTPLFVCGIIVLAVAGVFGQTLGYDFVNFDDPSYVTENPYVYGGLRPDAVVWAFTRCHSGNWHPATWLSHMLDCQLFGLSPAGHHLTNVLWHASAAVVLFLALNRMTSAIGRSAFVALVFAIHPLRVESVAWVAERKDVLSGFWFMMTLLTHALYVRHPFSTWRYLAVIACLAVGLLSKQMLVTLPFVLLLLDYWPLGRLTEGSQWRRCLLEKLPMLVMSAAACAVTLVAQRDARMPGGQIPLSWRAANAAVGYCDYVVRFFNPTGLAVFYPHPGLALPAWKIMIAVLVLVGVTMLVFKGRRQRPFMLVGWLWYLGMLVPVIGIVQVGGQAIADRYTYLPQIGLCLGLTWGAADVTARRGWPLRMQRAAAAAIVVSLAAVAWRQTSTWRDSETLWRQALACTSYNALALQNLAKALEQQGRFEEAVVEYRNVLQLLPDKAVTHNSIGAILLRLGRPEDAIRQFQQALAINSRDAVARTNLGDALADLGRSSEAMDSYREALGIDADCIEARYNLADTLYQQGLASEAVAEWRRLLLRHPDLVVALNRTARELATHPDPSVRDGREAVELARRAASLAAGRSPEVLDTLGCACAEAGRFDEAVLVAQEAASLATTEGKEQLAEEIRRRIESYKALSPWREGRGR